MNEYAKKSPIIFDQIDLSDRNILNNVEEIEDLIMKRQDIIVPWPDKPTFTIGARQEGKVIGVVQVSEDGHINYIVHPDYQGKGIASKLLEKAIGQAKNRSIKRLAASVESDSISQHILEKFKFVEHEQVEDKGNRFFYLDL